MGEARSTDISMKSLRASQGGNNLVVSYIP